MSLFGITVPLWYVILITVIGVLCLVFVYKTGKVKAIDAALISILFINIGLVIGVTLINRDTGLVRTARWYLFYSYRNIFDGVNSSDFIKQGILNIILFVPTGMLSALYFRDFDCHKNLIYSLICGCGLSCMVESVQLVFKLGLFEWDDIFHNTFGAFVGICIAFSLLHQYYKARMAKSDKATDF